ncbi:hypothetical protein VTI28DRAFT_341 [Corynascus sepedonium]
MNVGLYRRIGRATYRPALSFARVRAGSSICSWYRSCYAKVFEDSLDAVKLTNSKDNNRFWTRRDGSANAKHEEQKGGLPRLVLHELDLTAFVGQFRVYKICYCVSSHLVVPAHNPI